MRKPKKAKLAYGFYEGGMHMSEKILTILLELWADQNGLEIQELIITEREVRMPTNGTI